MQQPHRIHEKPRKPAPGYLSSNLTSQSRPTSLWSRIKPRPRAAFPRRPRFSVETAEFRGPIRAEITPEGNDCIDQTGGDVRAYLNAKKASSAGTSITTNIGTLNSRGALVVGSSDFKQNVTVNAEPAALANFAQVLLDQIGQLNLKESIRTQVREALDEVQREANKAEPDRAQVGRAFGRAVGFLVDAGKPVATALFFLAAHHFWDMPTP